MYRQASTVPFPTFYDGNAVNRMLVLSAFPLPSLQLLRTWYPLGNVVTKLRMLLCLLLKFNRWLPALPLWRLSTSLRRHRCCEGWHQNALTTSQVGFASCHSGLLWGEQCLNGRRARMYHPRASRLCATLHAQLLARAPSGLLTRVGPCSGRLCPPRCWSLSVPAQRRLPQSHTEVGRCCCRAGWMPVRMLPAVPDLSADILAQHFRDIVCGLAPPPTRATMQITFAPLTCLTPRRD